MASVAVTSAGHKGARIVVDLGPRDRLVIRVADWDRNRRASDPVNAYLSKQDVWIIWERRKSERHTWSNAGHAWLGQATLDLHDGSAEPLVQHEDEGDEEPVRFAQPEQLTGGE